MDRSKYNMENMVRALYPPFLYFFITMIVEGIVGIILFFRKNEKTETGASMWGDFNDFMENFSENLDRYTYIITLCAAGIAVFVFGYIYLNKVRESHRERFIDRIKIVKGKNTVLIVLVGFFGSTGLSRLVSILPLDHVIGDYESASSGMLRGSIVIQIVSLAIIVPIAEEFIYRGIMFARLKEMMDVRMAAFMTSLIFGLFHFNLLQGTYTFLLSILMIMVLMRYDSIIPGIMIHAIANCTAVLSNYFGTSEIFDKNIMRYVSTMTVELMIGVFALIVLMKKEKENSDKMIVSKKSKKVVDK